jgi:predicted ATPase/DNA-binding CsgD family transcriptional regulator
MLSTGPAATMSSMAVRSLRASCFDPPVASAAPNNLPVQLTSFVGRRDELDELRGLVATTRLLSLNGAGGCGKTRIALQLAAAVSASYTGGVWFVELAPVGDPSRVLATVASALGEADLTGDLVEVIVGRLQADATLVVLDNCEHLLGPVAALVDTLLRRCSPLSIVATSREPLGVPGETGWRVPSLAMPIVATATGAAGLSEFDAVRLFADRATSARTNFRLTDDNASAIAQICHRLDGIPLAIELAAARVRGLTVAQIAAGLDDRFRLLTGGARTVLPRQQTLQASVDWSYELLSDAERAVFRRLAVFAGGFTLDAAEAIAVDDDVQSVEVLDLLLGLVDKSMVVADVEHDRYRTLETLRQYGTARLVDAREIAETRRRHLVWAVTVCEPLTPLVSDRGHLAQVDPEVDNLRSAYEWSLLASDADAALTIAAVLMRWEGDRGDATEMTSLGTRALAVPGGQIRLQLVVMASMVYAQFEAGDIAACRATSRALLEKVDELGPDDVDVRVYCHRMASFAPGRRSYAPMPEVLEVARAAGLDDAVAMISSMLAVRAAWLGNWREAEQHAAGIAGDPFVSVAAANAALARIASAEFRGNFDIARALLDSLGFDQHSQPRLAAQMIATQVRIDLAQGRDTGAASRLIPMIEEARRRRFVSGIALAGWGPGAWALAHGDIDAAVRDLVTWRAETFALRYFSPRFSLVLVQALLADRRVGEARDTFDEIRGYVVNTDPFNQAKLSDVEGLVSRAEGDTAHAERRHHDAITAFHARGLRPDLVHALESLAGVASVQESFAECARIAGAAQSLRDEMGYVLRWPYEQRTLDADLDGARQALGDRAFAVAFEEGRALDEDAVVSYAQRARGERKRPTTGWESLTPTESEVARLVAEGLTNKQVAQRLLMGSETVKTHLARVYDKLGVRSRAALATELAATDRPATYSAQARGSTAR